ncbi:MAG: hypothetical protein GIX02_10275 [Candidatus Eremiobacteraeota bacterium]|nr:hypothetical protein [Candidatus Eremiobacteraeota bacterium]
MPLQSVLALRSQIERRWHSAVAHQGSASAPALCSGIADLDALLRPGGIPAGRLTEILGEPSSGKTGIALAILTAALRAGGIGAYVDPSRTFFAPFAAHAGLDLGRFIVVRPTNPASARSAVDALVRGGACAAVVVDCSGDAELLQTHHCARLAAQAERTGTALIALSHGNVSALAYFASLRLHVWGIAPLWQQGAECVQLLGYRARVGILKSRTSAPGASALLMAVLPDVAGSWPIHSDDRMDFSDAPNRLFDHLQLFQRGVRARESLLGRTAAGGG